MDTKDTLTQIFALQADLHAQLQLLRSKRQIGDLSDDEYYGIRNAAAQIVFNAGDRNVSLDRLGLAVLKHCVYCLKKSVEQHDSSMLMKNSIASPLRSM